MFKKLTVITIALALVVGACTFSVSVSESETLEVTVGAKLVDCVGVGPMKCMVVDGEFFYDNIDGFHYEEGYVYRLRMEQYDAWPGQKEPPQDASRYGYRLIEVISKTPGYLGP